MKLIISINIIALSIVNGIILENHQESGHQVAQVEEDIQEYDHQPQYYGGHEIEHESAGGGGGGYEDHPHERPQAAFEKKARVIKQYFESNPHGYHNAYETENGIKAQESGSVESEGEGGGGGVRMQGAYSYTGDDGRQYTVRYTADEHGFRAEGAHLPTAPPTPHDILHALEQNALDEAQGVHDDGSYQHEPEQHEEQLQGPQFHQLHQAGHDQLPQEPLYSHPMLHYHHADHYRR